MRRLLRVVEVEGRGVHTGQRARARLLPTTGGGRRFVRVDLPGRPVVEANPSSLAASERCTALRSGDASVSTVEHLLSALQGAGVADVSVELEGPELPILDGSALPWLEALLPALGPAHPGPPAPALSEPAFARQGGAFAAALPHDGLRFSYHIDFPYPIGQQWLTVDLGEQAVELDRYLRELAPARTFALEREVEALRARGLLRGGELSCAAVAGPAGWVNPPLRFGDEPVRHKLLDLIGDLALLGVLPRAHYVACRAGHRLHAALAAKLWERPGR